MAQPTNFGFGEEEVMLRDSARKFFADKLPTERLHALVGDDPDPHRSLEARWDPALWQQMMELGWAMLAVPERAGGMGLGAVAVVALCEEVGRAAFPAPLLATLNATYILAACGSAAADQAMAEIIGGTAVSFAAINRQGSWEYPDTDVTVADGSLSGQACYVQDAQKVQHFVVKARCGSGTGLYWVAADAVGVTIIPDAIVDLTRDQARVEFSDVAAIELSDDAVAALNQAMPALWTLQAADMVGAAEWQLQTTVEYAKVRKQFDRELGFFQAVKHPLVNVMVAIDQSKSLVYNAACAIDSEPGKAARFAHMANASASDAAAFASSRSVQFHGGIGFTWECFIHLYFKRQLHNQALWGDAAYHRTKLADMVIGPVAA